MIIVSYQRKDYVVIERQLTGDIEVHAQTRCAQRVALRLQPTAWIDNVLASVLYQDEPSSLTEKEKGTPNRVISPFHHFVRLAMLTEAKSIVGEKLPAVSPRSGGMSEMSESYLVRREAVVQLDDANLITTLAIPEPSKGEHFICAVLGHRVAHHIHCTTRLEGGRIVGCQSLTNDLYGLVFQAMLAYKALGRHDAASTTVLYSSLCEGEPRVAKS